MPTELTQPDRQLVLRLGIMTQEIALLHVDLEERKSVQKALVYSLVSRGMISLSRAARICEVQRQTISRWVAELEETDLSEMDQITARYSKEIWPD